MPRPASGVALCLVRRLFAEGSVAGLTDAQLLTRFARDRDEGAFAALVDRHGPMVLAVCRAATRDPGDAEDAFQATFLTLARRADRFEVRGDSLGGWLHRVAHRAAARTSAEAARRRAVERQAADAADRRAADPAPLAELREAVHLEVGRLPERCRLPVVLCYLEGKTTEEAASALRWGEKTVRRRLGDARELLRSRLARAGVVPTVGLLELLRPDAVSAADALARSASVARRAAELSTAGPAAILAGTVSALVARLSQVAGTVPIKGVVTTAVAALVIVSPIDPGRATDGGESSPRPAPSASSRSDESPAPRAAPAPSPPRSDDAPPADLVSIAGRVVGPDGAPVAGADVTVFQIAPGDDFPPGAIRARSGPDGSYRIEVDRSRLRGLDAVELVPVDRPILAASAPGSGPAWIQADGPEGLDGQTLRLVEEGVPLRGRVLDLEGRPVPGAVVRPYAIIAAEGEDLLAALDAAGGEGARRRLRSPSLDARVAGLPREVVADAEGRLSIAGIGRDRLLLFTIAAPTIATEQLYATNRSGPGQVLEEFDGPGTRPETLLGNPFEHLAQPSVPIEGIVRSAETGRPIAGVLLRGRGGDVLVEAESDAEGRYRMLGVPKLERYEVAALPGDLPFVGASGSAPGGPGLGPVTVDFDLMPGVVLRGRLAELGTGAPVLAEVTYLPFLDNPAADAISGIGTGNHWVEWDKARTAEDGSFTLVVPPGHGLLIAQSAFQRYAPGHGADRIAGLGEDEPASATLPELPAVLPESLLEVDLPADAPPAPVLMEFDPGTTIRGVVLGPDAKPAPHARVYIREDGKTRHHTAADEEGRFRLAVSGSEFESGVPLVAISEGLAPGFARVDAGEQDAQLRFRVDDVPILGRVLDLEGRPVAGVAIRPRLVQEPEEGDLSEWLRAARTGDAGANELENRFLGRSIMAQELGLSGELTTDAEGRFRLDGVGRERLIELQIVGPGIRYAAPHVMTRPGAEAFDLPYGAGSTNWGVVQYYGPNFDHFASPSRPIEGVVRDIDTGEPLAGVQVHSYQFAEFPLIGATQLSASTDGEGRFRLDGMSPAEGNDIIAFPPVDQPYLPSIVAVEAPPPGLDPSTMDIPLKRGVWIEGRVTDEETGEPIRGGFVQYGVLRDNPSLAECPGLGGAERWADFRLDVEGRYRVPGLPGQGVIGVVASGGRRYLTVKDQEDGGARFEGLDIAPRDFYLGAINELAEVDIPKGADSFRCDLALTPGRTRTILVEDPEGRPLSGYRVSGHWHFSNWTDPQDEAAFTLDALPRSGTRTLRFQHKGQGLAASLELDLSEEHEQPIRVTLVPWGVALGRLVDRDGRPRAGVRLDVAAQQGERRHSVFDHDYGTLPLTDADGRFRIEGLFPGQPHQIRPMRTQGMLGHPIAERVEAGSGETLDLGEVREEERP
ncbi:sigma-70 family RNA polymerase sigma factor [Tautonia plasticadhaerens]|uniref:ECF RNA polymerase sigma-E factor n=1 Tax=Tautonia plasticadhaerens TaxID=2527974 RepID=A0A518HEC9_9BACT|nr:sigma-70 family RNA polymerase sigma factor [Tautonia plasticadhaerens]QDV39198.1 ECF RNA polymerase sigma-E factor [Tautonia plasticadhaerens]